MDNLIKEAIKTYPDLVIDISGLDKADVLMALYNNSHFVIHNEEYESKDMTREEAKKILSESTWVDYIKNRPIKVHFDEDYIFGNLYDRTNGQGACRKAIDELRGSKS